MQHTAAIGGYHTLVFAASSWERHKFGWAGGQQGPVQHTSAQLEKVGINMVAVYGSQAALPYTIWGGVFGTENPSTHHNKLPYALQLHKARMDTQHPNSPLLHSREWHPVPVSPHSLVLNYQSLGFRVCRCGSWLPEWPTNKENRVLSLHALGPLSQRVVLTQGYSKTRKY